MQFMSMGSAESESGSAVPQRSGRAYNNDNLELEGSAGPGTGRDRVCVSTIVLTDI